MPHWRPVTVPYQQLDLSAADARISLVSPANLRGVHRATAGTLITCTEAAFSTSRYTGSEESSTPYIGTEVLPIKLVPVAGAAAGASGSVAVTVSAPSPVVTNSGNMSVSLTDGPDLVLKKSTAELYGTH